MHRFVLFAIAVSIGCSSNVEKPLLGVAPDHLVKFKAAAAEFPERIRAGEGQDNVRKNARIWGPNCLPDPGPQQDEDCTSWGGGTAIRQRSWFSSGQAQSPEPFQPHLYYMARHDGRKTLIPCGSGGGYPSALVKGLEASGWGTYEEAGVSYNRSRAVQWGCNGPPAAFAAKALLRKGVHAHPIRSIEEWRDATCNGYTLTVAIPWQPGKPYRGKNGKVYIPFNGRNQGGHQLASLAYDGSDGIPSWALSNSHGANWPGLPNTDGTPPGTCWLDEQWARWVVANGELWAFSDVPGFESDDTIDWNAFDRLMRAQLLENQQTALAIPIHLVPRRREDVSITIAP